MNIFFSDANPEKAAFNLDFKRVNKMLLESCQMLSTSVNELGGRAPYKSTHKNHPSNVWARQSLDNFCWLLNHANFLSYYYTKGSGKIHACSKILSELLNNLEEIKENFPKRGLTPFANCAANDSKGINFKSIQDPIEAYRRYLIARWNDDFKTPDWRHIGKLTLFELNKDWLGVDNSDKFFYKSKKL